MHLTFVATLFLGALGGLTAQGSADACIFAQSTGPFRDYIVVFKEGLEQETASALAVDLTKEIECQGGRVKHVYSFGGFNAVAASFPSRLTNSINSRSGPFGKNVKNIERDQLFNGFSVDF